MSEPTGFGMVPRHLEGKLTAIELAVYVALSWNANPEGKCWPSHKSLARSAGCSESSVKTALKNLRAKGLVSWENRTSPEGDPTSNVYYLSVWERKKRPKASANQTGDDPGVGQEVPQGGSPGTDEQDHLNKTNASSSKKDQRSAPINEPTMSGLRGRQRDNFDVDSLVAELEYDFEANGYLANHNWFADTTEFVEAAVSEVREDVAIKDPAAWLTTSLKNLSPVGKAYRLMKIVGEGDYDDD
ncbi:hypothetical protein GCM10009804_03000 [Kribbella hippodromi]|uniref:Helix-turn-helix domain-containing protein n=1 Tax=Kribbella hippodromi TaxID=434347 RepID=A0ABN2C1M9_9ACTN